MANPDSNAWLPEELKRSLPEEENGSAPPPERPAPPSNPPSASRQWLLDDAPADTEAKEEPREPESKSLEAQLEEAKGREADLNRRIEELQAELEERRAPRHPVQPSQGEVDLNDATFEELRGLGLSVTQSERLILYRDSRGGFGSENELDEVPGFPDELRQSLKQQIKLG